MFDDMIANMEANKLLSPLFSELFMRGRKSNISLAFISQSYSKVHKDIRLTAIRYFIMKIPDKRELQQIASCHSSGTNFKDFIKLEKYYIK